jgi:radical SAM protein with 4Fe4S-binding SPASM domain
MQRGSGKRLEDISSEVFQLRKEINSLAQLYQVRIERSGLYPQGYNKGIESAKFYGCSALRTGMYVSSEGLVFPCNLANNPIGNVYKNSISDIWKSENSQKIRDITSCKETSCDIACGGKCKAKEI